MYVCQCLLWVFIHVICEIITSSNPQQKVRIWWKHIFNLFLKLRALKHWFLYLSNMSPLDLFIILKILYFFLRHPSPNFVRTSRSTYPVTLKPWPQVGAKPHQVDFESRVTWKVKCTCWRVEIFKSGMMSKKSEIIMGGVVMGRGQVKFVFH